MVALSPYAFELLRSKFLRFYVGFPFKSHGFEFLRSELLRFYVGYLLKSYGFEFYFWIHTLLCWISL